MTQRFLGFQFELLGDKIHYLDDIGVVDDHSWSRDYGWELPGKARSGIMGKPKAKGEAREASPINETEKSGRCEECGGCPLAEAGAPSPFKKEGVIYQHKG